MTFPDRSSEALERIADSLEDISAVLHEETPLTEPQRMALEKVLDDYKNGDIDRALALEKIEILTS